MPATDKRHKKKEKDRIKKVDDLKITDNQLFNH